LQKANREKERGKGKGFRGVAEKMLRTMEKRGLKRMDKVRHEYELRSQISRNRGTLPLGAP